MAESNEGVNLLADETQKDGSLNITKVSTMHSDFDGLYTIDLGIVPRSGEDITKYVPADVVLVLDVSGSMDANLNNSSSANPWTNSRMYGLIQAADSIVEELSPSEDGTRIGILIFGSNSSGVYANWSAHKIILDFTGDREAIRSAYYPTRIAGTNPRSILASASTKEVVRLSSNPKWFPLQAPYTNYNQNDVDPGAFAINTGTNHYAGFLGALELFKYTQNERRDQQGNILPSKKYVIFMTDGEMGAIYNETGGNGSSSLNQYWGKTGAGTGTIPTNHPGPTPAEFATLQQALNLKTTFSKADPYTDIELYTVAYGLVADPLSLTSGSESARKILNPGHPTAGAATYDYDETRRYEYQKKFIPAPTAAELEEAFKEIAKAINREIPFNQVRITDPMGLINSEAIALLYDRNGDGVVTTEDISVLVDDVECIRGPDPSDPMNPLKAIFTYPSNEGGNKAIEIELEYTSSSKQFTIHFFHTEALDDGRSYVIQYDIAMNTEHEDYEPGASYPANETTEVAYNYAGEDYVDEAPIPEIIYAPIKETIPGFKRGENGLLVAGAFEFGLFYDLDCLIPVEDENNNPLRAVNDAAGEFQFEVHLGHPATHIYYLKELQQVIGDGWVLDQEPIRVEITVEETSPGVLGVTKTDFSRSYFKNTYGGGKPIDIKILGKKTAFPLQSGSVKTFEFGLFEGSSNTPQLTTNDGNGDFSFTINISDAGDYLYYVRELSPDAYGWKSDTTIYTYTISVTDNYLGELEAEIYGDQGTITGNQIAIEFLNTFDPDEAGTIIQALKTLVGWQEAEKVFEFVLQEYSPGNNSYEATNELGVVNFQVNYTQAGSYVYEMFESQVDWQGWVMDTTKYMVKVEVTPDAAGTLVSDVKYYDLSGTELVTPPTFINRYNAGDVTVMIEGMKTGNTTLPVNTFHFQLLDERKNVKDTVMNDADGKITLTTTFDQTGVYAYTVKEVATSGNGWTTDLREYPVLITVEDVGGELVANVEYPLPISFTNTYSAGSHTAEIIAHKTLIGWDATEASFVEKFEFDLIDKNGNILLTETSDDQGIVRFQKTFADFNAVGRYEFEIVEKSLTSKPGWELVSPLPNTQHVIVNVEINPNNELTSTIEYKDSMIFENKYTPAPTFETLSGVIVPVGAPLPSDPFEVTLFENGVPIQTYSAQDGSFKFDLEFKEVGTYLYEVRQTDDVEREGWIKIDSSIYKVIITVTDNYHGQLVSSVVGTFESEPCETNRLDFQNIYQAKALDSGIQGYKEFKKWDGGTWVDWNEFANEEIFEFTLVDPKIGDSGKTMDKTHSQNGLIDFSILYSEAGTYSYEIREVQTPRLGWKLDQSVYQVTVVIEANYDDGTYEVTSLVYDTANNQPPHFVNYYTTPKVEADLSATVEIKGWYGKKEFPFILVDANGVEIGEAIWSVDGFVKIPSLPELTFSEEGEYEFTIYQPTTEDANWRIDDRKLSVIISAYHDGAGGLALSLKYPEGEWHFINEYIGEPECVCLKLEADVEVCEARRICPGLFRFSVTGENGEVYAVAKTYFKNDGDYCLTASFTGISFTKPGTYCFTMWQLSAHSENWSFDQKAFPLKVTVEALSTGELVAQVEYLKGCPTFINRYHG